MGGGPAPLDAGFSVPAVCVAPPQALPCSSSRECVPGPCVSPPQSAARLLLAPPGGCSPWTLASRARPSRPLSALPASHGGDVLC